MFALLKKPFRSKTRPPEITRRPHWVGERALPLTIRENVRATRITLRIDPGGRGLSVTVPVGLRKSEIEDFLERHQAWLAARLSHFNEENTLLRDGGVLCLRGVEHRIEHTGNLRGITEAIQTPDGPVLRVSGMEGHMGRRLSAYLKKEARKDLEIVVAGHAAAIRKPVAAITMKDTRSRWGSCSWDGRLAFSWRIVMAPPEVIDYLAAHEVAHLREMNHGADFWALCRQLCPKTEEARRWLKQNGSRLHAIDFD
jgi:predicted metal-dependent hydrolase